MLFQQLVNRMCSHCLFPACWQVVNSLLTTAVDSQLATRFLTSTGLLQVVPTTCYLCYRPAIQQFVNKLWVTTLSQLDKTTALLQLVDKPATSLLRTHLVDKLWDFYVCNRRNITKINCLHRNFLKIVSSHLKNILWKTLLFRSYIQL
jgi:hypothetical protein